MQAETTRYKLTIRLIAGGSFESPAGDTVAEATALESNVALVIAAVAQSLLPSGYTVSANRNFGGRTTVVASRPGRYGRPDVRTIAFLRTDEV